MHCCAYVITFTLDMVFLFFNGHGHGLVSNASSGPTLEGCEIPL